MWYSPGTIAEKRPVSFRPSAWMSQTGLDACNQELVSCDSLVQSRPFHPVVCSGFVKLLLLVIVPKG